MKNLINNQVDKIIPSIDVSKPLSPVILCLVNGLMYNLEKAARTKAL